MKTWTVKINEEELRALIIHHNYRMLGAGNVDIETSARIHDLTKRLNRETPEIEGDPRPQETKSQETKQQETKPQEVKPQEVKSPEAAPKPTSLPGW